MGKAKKQTSTWKVRSLRSDYGWEGVLVAYWEVYLDPISNDYTPREIDARALFYKWEKRVRKEFRNGLIPISWFVECREEGKFNYMPFQFNHFLGHPVEDFLTFFTWPVNSVTGEPLNWLTLPVVDKLWNTRRADKGGFIQQATGWKPAILQPYVYLPALSSALQQA
jgi:hypothetical protein